MFKFTFTMLAVFPFCCSDLCAAAYHNIVGTTIGARSFKLIGCWAAKKYGDEQRKKREFQRMPGIRNINNRNYNPYGY